MILLHDPHAKIGVAESPSSERLLTTALAIMDLMYGLSATTYDFIQLDYSCSFCWFLTGTVLVRFLRVRLVAEEREEARWLRSEINVAK